MKIPLFDFSIWESRTFRIGMVFYFISLFFLGISLIDKKIMMHDGGILLVFLNMLFFLIYFIALGSDNRRRVGSFWKFHDIRKNIPLLLLLFSSAFTLNLEIRIFEDSVEWLQALLILSHISLILFCFRPRPLQADAINFGILFILSLGFVFGIYGSCLLYTSPSPRDATLSRMPSSA